MTSMAIIFDREGFLYEPKNIADALEQASRIATCLCIADKLLY